MDTQAPLVLLRMAVEREWIDYNGHMNVGYFVVAFDRATDEFIDRLGMDAAYRERSGCSVYVLETHVTYQHELKLGDEIDVDLQLVDLDPRRLHFFMRMHRAAGGELAATSEIMLMHVDLEQVKGADMPPDVHARAERLLRAHASLPVPPELGRRIGIRRR
jgi:acyl-CoA thioester hydrolase